MLSILERVTVVCFAASYAMMLGLELAHMWRPRPALRVASLAMGVAGVLAHSVYLIVQSVNLPLLGPAGSVLFLALILAIFTLYGTVHHNRVLWGIFVLPLVLLLIGLAMVSQGEGSASEAQTSWSYFWGQTHGVLLLLAAVGVCVGFSASFMYLVQQQRLQAKLTQGPKLLSLERLEEMNRNAILTAFPLLTAGLFIGIALQLHHGTFLEEWNSPRIFSGLMVWVVFVILLYLRYAVHVRGRRVALLTMLASVLLITALLSPLHSFTGAGR